MRSKGFNSSQTVTDFTDLPTFLRPACTDNYSRHNEKAKLMHQFEPGITILSVLVKLSVERWIHTSLHKVTFAYA